MPHAYSLARVNLYTHAHTALTCFMHTHYPVFIYTHTHTALTCFMHTHYPVLIYEHTLLPCFINVHCFTLKLGEFITQILYQLRQLYHCVNCSAIIADIQCCNLQLHAYISLTPTYFHFFHVIYILRLQWTLNVLNEIYYL